MDRSSVFVKDFEVSGWFFLFPYELEWSYTYKPQGQKKLKKKWKAEAVPKHEDEEEHILC